MPGLRILFLLRPYVEQNGDNRSAEQFNVLPDVRIQLLAAVLHDEARMGKRDDLLEPRIFLVEFGEKVEVLPFTDAVALFLAHAKVDHLVDAVYRKRPDGSHKLSVVVIVDVFSGQRKSKRRNG